MSGVVDETLPSPWRFEARSSNASVLLAQGQGHPAALLTGVAPGTATLSVVERRGGALFDRHAVEVAAIRRAVLVPFYDPVLFSSRVYSSWRERRWRLFPAALGGGAVTAMLWLFDDRGRRLIDESMTAEVSAGDVSLAREARRWDRFSLTAGGAAESATVTLRNAGPPIALQVESGTNVDSLAWFANDLSRHRQHDPAPPAEGFDVVRYDDELSLLCFTPLEGETAVLGAPVSYSVSGTLYDLSLPNSGGAGTFTSTSFCQYLGGDAGDGTFTARFAGFSVTVRVRILPAPPTG